MTPVAPARSRDLASLWNDIGVRKVAFQAVLVACVAAIVFILWWNASGNIARRGLEVGFAFLSKTANFAIGESVISYSPADTYARALLAGLSNTVVIAISGCLLTTVFGVLFGILRLSPNPFLSRLVGVYVEIGRNVPLLLQLFFWYSLCTRLNGPRQATSPLPGVFLSNRGLRLPSFVANDGLLFAALGFFFAGIVWLVLRAWARRLQERTGQRPRIMPWGLAVLVLAPLAGAHLATNPIAVDMPELQGFNFVGGQEFSPEFVALLFGLVFYTTAFVTEIVRGGIQSVSKGQWEAARSLGLPAGSIMRLVILPQAMRTIIPPLASQYINLTKNSSLAVAIGFPDLINISNTVINQTGQALEVIFIFMGSYLAVNLLISALMNRLNAAFLAKEG
ncbi:amino acid ABC transporter permease [Bosea sp. (in: a-proteobacteria)]|uniref:amino acid ABC transporter permease n=1 Tax=Bosea sp. (in: a-proteobacteria) TaxID=1871050 RepID=UPI002FCA4276